MREADVAIRLSPPTQPDLIQRHLFTGHMGIFAAPSYLKKYGSPNNINDIHRVIQQLKDKSNIDKKLIIYRILNRTYPDLHYSDIGKLLDKN